MKEFYAFFYYRSQNLPVVMEVTDSDKFTELCLALPTDWAFLIDKKTGAISRHFQNCPQDQEIPCS